MKTTINRTIAVIAICCAMSACHKETPNTAAPTPATHPGSMQLHSGSSHYVHYTEANEAIESYLSSIDTFTTPQLQSFSLDADVLRTYLQDPTITTIKISLGHTSNVISQPYDSVYHYLNAGSTTLFIAGLNTSGDYVLIDDVYVVNRVLACPINCPTTGDGTSPLYEP